MLKVILKNVNLSDKIRKLIETFVKYKHTPFVLKTKRNRKKNSSQMRA